MGKRNISLPAKRRMKMPEFLQKKVLIEQRIVISWTAQLCLDIMSDILNDKDIMGKDVFGKKRLLKIGQAFNERYPEWKKGLSGDPTADYVRAKIDARMKEIYGDDSAPWEERYEFFED